MTEQPYSKYPHRFPSPISSPPPNKKINRMTVLVSGVASVVQVNVTTRRGHATGSGVVLTSTGRILTNAHVVQGATAVTLTLSDGAEYKADVQGSNTGADIAVLQARDASGLTPATLGDSSRVKVGQPVVAIGAPGGLHNSVTSGTVSAVNRTLSGIGEGQYPRAESTTSESGYTAIQTDAPIDEGNSGGALVDLSDQVIGISSARYNPAGSARSASSSGVGFAIPINDAKTIVNQIVGG